MIKNVVVTGGSRGIGAACVRLFSERGCNVVFCYASNDAAAQAVAEQTGAFAVRCNVADPSEVDAFALRALARLGRVDAVINNAGVCSSGLFQDISNEEISRLLGVNLLGTMYACRAFLPHMIGNKSGAIVNVSSIYGVCGGSCEVAYSASKGAVIGFTRALAREVAPSNVRVNAVAPGVIDTDINAHLTAADLAALQQQIPCCRIGTPAEAAEAIYFLCDDRSSYINGQILVVDGGMI